MKSRFDDLIVGRWGARFQGRRFPCSIGRGGIALDKREGDGATPVGAMRLVSGRYRADRLARPLPARRATFPMRPIRAADIWSDDPNDPDYNHGLNTRTPFGGHERMMRADRLYDLVVMTDWNWPTAEPGRGSAIFVHLWKTPRKPTAGCVAFRRKDLTWIINRWTRRSRLVVQPPVLSP